MPAGTVVNPKFPAATSYNTPAGIGCLIMGAVQDVVSKMLLCSDRWKEDVYANTAGGGHSATLVGYDAHHVPFQTSTMDCVLGGMGALVDKDGEEAGSNMWTPKTKHANIESKELLFPIMYLTRCEAIDTGGPGKFRGGVASVAAMMPWKAEELTIINKDWGMEPRIGNGLAGGYPAPQTAQWIIKNSNIVERLKRGDFPNNFNEIGGEWEILPPLLMKPLNSGEVLLQYQSGGGGFGDPIEREPQLVLEDVKLGYVSLEAAKDVYGVVIDPEELIVRLNETLECRQKIIDDRLRLGMKGRK